jgi:hypothetical protein
MFSTKMRLSFIGRKRRGRSLGENIKSKALTLLVLREQLPLNTKNFNPQSLLKPSILFWTGIVISIDIGKNDSRGFTNPP